MSRARLRSRHRGSPHLNWNSPDALTIQSCGPPFTNCTGRACCLAHRRWRICHRDALPSHGPLHRLRTARRGISPALDRRLRCPGDGIAAVPDRRHDGDSTCRPSTSLGAAPALVHAFANSLNFEDGFSVKLSEAIAPRTCRATRRRTPIPEQQGCRWKSRRPELVEHNAATILNPATRQIRCETIIPYHISSWPKRPTAPAARKSSLSTAQRYGLRISGYGPVAASGGRHNRRIFDPLAGRV